VIVPSASPARGLGEPEDDDCAGETLPASVLRWERIVRGIAEEHGVFVALANLVGEHAQDIECSTTEQYRLAVV